MNIKDCIVDNKDNITESGYNLYKLKIRKSNAYHSEDVYAVAENITDVADLFVAYTIYEVTLIEKNIYVKL